MIVHEKFLDRSMYQYAVYVRTYEDQPMSEHDERIAQIDAALANSLSPGQQPTTGTPMTDHPPSPLSPNE